MRVSWFFVGECGKVEFALSDLDHVSDFARFDQFSEELVGIAIDADFLEYDPHPCFPYDPIAGDQSLIITSAKKIIKVINYDYTTPADSVYADQVRVDPDTPTRVNSPFGYISADITVKLAVIVPAEAP